ncbi:IS66 family insertion sequence element accessory protein TnpB [Chitinophaga sancti]|uniref:IS66 family insertion sequence element accessory protein TnpB n=1 Tax=Chitinophaga sancti TaxID=1004 RepID=UPI002A766589|nr:IS66 family insertion sequence element accessory protein TnpB [Chitinophaga sancti]WPQ63801.1 IS66 family insertion sequence element accessory protein TnpB [Chitinophaga sancti]
MLSLSGYRLVLWNGATDMRLSFNGLSGLVVNEMQEDPFHYGTLYAFFNHRRTQVKILGWDVDGLGIFYKRLSRGTFGTPVYDNETKKMVLNKKDLMLILEGVEVRFRKRYERSARHHKS